MPMVLMHGSVEVSSSLPATRMKREELTTEIVELMAASDNVLNVGFTPDKNSTKLVAQAITAKSSPASDLILKRQKFDKGQNGNTVVFATPFEEFSILKISGDERLAPLSGPGIAIVTDSQNTTIGDRKAETKSVNAPSGSVWFIGAGAELEVRGQGDVWMAFYDGDRSSSGEVGKQ